MYRIKATLAKELPGVSLFNRPLDTDTFMSEFKGLKAPFKYDKAKYYMCAVSDTGIALMGENFEPYGDGQASMILKNFDLSQTYLIPHTFLDMVGLMNKCDHKRSKFYYTDLRFENSTWTLTLAESNPVPDFPTPKTPLTYSYAARFKLTPFEFVRGQIYIGNVSLFEIIQGKKDETTKERPLDIRSEKLYLEQRLKETGYEIRNVQDLSNSIVVYEYKKRRNTMSSELALILTPPTEPETSYMIEFRMTLVPHDVYYDGSSGTFSKMLDLHKYYNELQGLVSGVKHGLSSPRIVVEENEERKRYNVSVFGKYGQSPMYSPDDYAETVRVFADNLIKYTKKTMGSYLKVLDTVAKTIGTETNQKVDEWYASTRAGGAQ